MTITALDKTDSLAPIAIDAEETSSSAVPEVVAAEDASSAGSAPSLIIAQDRAAIPAPN